MIYMYKRPPTADTSYLFTDNKQSRYGSDGTYLENLEILLAHDSWTSDMEFRDDRQELLATFETLDEFKQLFPELCI